MYPRLSQRGTVRLRHHHQVAGIVISESVRCLAGAGIDGDVCHPSPRVIAVIGGDAVGIGRGQRRAPAIVGRDRGRMIQLVLSSYR